MDIGKLVSWAVFAALVYGGYKYLSTGDITIVPPPAETVLSLAKQADPNLANSQHISAGKACVRVNGGYIKQGLYSCEINVYAMLGTYQQPSKSYAILVEKRNGQWQLKK